MIYRGRKMLVSSYKQAELSYEKVVHAINTVMATHLQNQQDIEYLMRYRSGLQPILNKEKVVRDEINHKIVVNHAQMITRAITGYFLGTPIQYIQNGDSTKKTEIDALNRYVSYEDKASTDRELGEFQSVCGVAHRIIYTDGILADEVPFEDRSLDPRYTFIIYENDISNKPLIGVTYIDMYDADNNRIGRTFYAYTNNGVYEITTRALDGNIDPTATYSFTQYSVGGIPIIEYPNNMWRMGDWELCLELMDAINAVQSGRLDDIDQIIQSLLVFINAELTVDGYDEMREKGVVLLRNTTNNPSSVESITAPLDQAGMNMYAKELESLLYALVGIPSRDSRSGGGGDTGQAVELRDGWADLEIVARNKELVFKRSERQTLKIILTILRNVDGSSLTLKDVDVKFTRNKNNNLLVKTQSYATLLTTKTLTPEDCLTIVDLVTDVNEYVSRGKAFWGDMFGNPPPVKESTSDTSKEESTKDTKVSE